MQPWISFCGDAPPVFAPFAGTMYEAVARAARAYPGHTALLLEGRRTAYRALLARIDAAAAALEALGVQGGDLCAICMPNLPQAIILLYALNRLGAAACMLYPRAAPEELRAALRESECRLLLYFDESADRVAEALRALERPPLLIEAGAAGQLPFPLSLLYPLRRKTKPRHLPGALRWNAFLRLGRRPSAPPAARADAAAAVLYTGGTGGHSKGVCCSSRSFNALAAQICAVGGGDDQPRDKLVLLGAMPIFHGFGLGVGVHAALANGLTCCLMPTFSADSLAKTVVARRVTHLPGVPTLFQALLRSPRLRAADLSFLRGVFCGGDSMPEALRTEVNDFLRAHNAPVTVQEGYGCTECLTVACLNPLWRNRGGSLGIPLPGMVCRIADPESGAVLPAGALGEIQISGPTLMLGYLRRPEASALAFHTDARGVRWLRTGDLGRLDADGYLWFFQRLSRTIVTSGYNVYPLQIEALLDAHPEVALACVIGVPDAYRMHAVKAYVVPAPGVAGDAALARRLTEYCEAHLSAYCVPRSFAFRPRLPLTLLGKVAYHLLEAEARAPESTQEYSGG